MLFSEFDQGQEFTTRGRTITEADVVNFAGLSGNYVWIHMDSERAAEGPFGQRIVQGPLVIAVMDGLLSQERLYNESVIAFAGMEELRFTHPTFIEDTLHVRTTVAETRRRDEDSGFVSFRNEVRNQDDETVMHCRTELLIADRV